MSNHLRSGFWAVLMSLMLAVTAVNGHAAGIGEQCQIGFNIPPASVCPPGKMCLQSITNNYCSDVGKVCGWGSTAGYFLGAQKQYNNKWYECFPGGFLEVKADGASCTANSQCKNHSCNGAAGNMVCGNPPSSQPPPPPPPAVQMRSLSTGERTLAQSVFGNSVNLDMVKLTNTLGAGERPWTTNTPPLYTINVGPDYNDMLSSAERRALLIHELTHVWQGQHAVPFMANSAAHQSMAAILNGGDYSPAYSYVAGADWSTYNVEQQAKIVQHWYQGRMSTTSELYPYLITNVRPGQPNRPLPRPADGRTPMNR